MLRFAGQFLLSCSQSCLLIIYTLVIIYHAGKNNGGKILTINSAYLERENVFNEAGDILRQSDIVTLHGFVHRGHDLVRHKLKVKSGVESRGKVGRHGFGVEKRVVDFGDVVECPNCGLELA